MARRGPILRIGSDAREPKRDLDDIKRKTEELGRVRAEARVQIATEAAEARLKLLNDRLDRLGKQQASPRIKMAMGTTLAQIERIEAKLAELGRKDVTIDVDIKRGAAERVSSGIGGIVSGAGRQLSTVLGTLGSSGANPLRAISSLMSLLPPQVLAVAAVIATAIGGIAIPTMFALAASFAAAAAAAVLLGGTLAAALVVPFGLVAVAIGKVVKVFQALKQEQQSHAQLAEQRRAAAEQEAQAQQSLADAYQNLTDQAQAARKAQEDAARAVPRDKLGVDQAKLNQSQARLDRQKAERELRQGISGTGSNAAGLFRKLTDVDVQTDPATISKLVGAAGGSNANSAQLQDLVLNVRQAKLRERGATLDLSDAVHRLNEDRKTEADFAKDGLKAYQPYTDALKQVKRQQDNLRAATHNASVELANQGTAMDKLSPADRRLADRLQTIGDRVKRAFGPAIGSVVDGIADAMDRLSKALDDKRIRSGLRSLGSAIGSSFRTLGRELSDPKFRRFFSEMLESAAAMAPDITRMFSVMGRTLRDLASVALPKVVSGIRTIRHFLDSFEEKTTPKNVGPQGLPIQSSSLQRAQRFKGFVDGLIDSFRDWVKVIKGVSLVVLAFFRAAKGGGDKLAGSIGDAALALGKKLNSPKEQQKLIRFFDRVKETVFKIADALKTIADILKRIKLPGNPSDPKSLIPGASLETSVADWLIDKITGKKHKGHALGGLIPGPGGFGDNILRPLEGGEFVIRRAIVNSLGVPALASLNATGRMPAAVGGGGGMHVDHMDVNILTPGGGPPDPTALGVYLDRQLRAKGWG